MNIDNVPPNVREKGLISLKRRAEGLEELLRDPNPPPNLVANQLFLTFRSALLWCGMDLRNILFDWLLHGSLADSGLCSGCGKESEELERGECADCIAFERREMIHKVE